MMLLKKQLVNIIRMVVLCVNRGLPSHHARAALHNINLTKHLVNVGGLVWGQDSLINNECTEKDSQKYFVIYI